ncbi:MAG: GGDEF domain-containing protein [Hyphomonadaceae bacterium]|nr:GGDEF domain-containing protein [Hyphomonadaceae bacterium]
MLSTSSRLHTSVYATLLSVVLICATVHFTHFVAPFLDGYSTNTVTYTALIASCILAPPASILMAVYSSKLIKIQEQLLELATTDPLTGLLNRRAFAHRYERESARYSRTNRPLSLLLIDLDYFKLINDKHGHAGGDAALRILSQHLRETSRFGTDDVARWGGEEFAVLLSDSGHQSAMRAAERLRRQIETLKVTFNDTPIRLEASVGVIVCRKGESLEHAVQRADLCLRQAKDQGRNRVMAFPEDLPAVDSDEVSVA